VRSLGYVVVGLEEYYTSKKCPNCEKFVGKVTIRQLFCPPCGKYFHRDVMAAQNMANLERGYLEDQKRPLYLQPRTADGKFPWLASSTSEQGAVDEAVRSTGIIKSTAGSARQKRSASTTHTPQERLSKVVR
ncbi:hypothetical protein BG004_005705, partial [Podila humilis]